MEFCFYPRHEYACPHVQHCPHLGGAALSTLVDAASDQGQYLEMLHGQLDFERAANARLVAENERLERELAQARLELKLERQRKFACGRETREDAPAPAAKRGQTGAKRGAPVGHPGWFRPTPKEYDQLVLVDAPAKCPHCRGAVRAFEKHEPSDHLQEDVIDNVHQVTLYRHAAGRCRACRHWVQQAGPGEILGSRIGPRMRALAIYLRNDIGISYRKVPRARWSPIAIPVITRIKPRPSRSAWLMWPDERMNGNR